MATDRSVSEEASLADAPPRWDERRRPFEDLVVSVVVPVYNDPDGIRTTLESLVTQSVPPTGYEVIVVDNGSTDDTRSVVRAFAARYDHVRLEVEADVQGSYAARNRGIEAASGSVLAFVDADMSVDPDWLRRAISAMHENDADYLACAVHLFAPGDEESLAGKYNRLTDLRVGRFVRERQFAPTCSLLVSRALLDEVGGFDPRFRSSGDLEFGNRVDDTGRQLHYAPQVPMYHPARTTMRSLLRKSFRIGRGKVELHRYYPDRYGHPLRRVANPLAYLPPTPATVRSSVRNWDRLTRREQAGFYALAYGTRLAKAAGQLREGLASVTTFLRTRLG
jgi:glycosyltransferase involved in cell wall biosynthesis